MTTDAETPSYAPMLRAFHRAYASELRAVVRSLPIREGDAVMDMACGDGAYLPWLSECVGGAGRVAAVDADPAFLEAAQGRCGATPNVEFVLAAVDALPFPDGTFDLCWCAQSLYSLPEPVAALQALWRVVKPGGWVAVLENDTLHHVVLPWPIDVELAARAAELAVLAEESGDPEKFYVGRNLRTTFREAGFEAVGLLTLTWDRSSPLGADERAFLAKHVEELASRAVGALDGSLRRRLEALCDPASGSYVLDHPDLTATCLGQVAWGRKPAGA